MKNSKGFSLIELSAGIAVMSILALAIGQLLISSVTQSKKTSVYHDVSSAHYQNLYRLQRLQQWRDLYTLATPIGKCLAGQNSEDCSTQEGVERDVTLFLTNCAGIDCYYESQATMKVKGCGTASCSSIDVTLTTTNTKIPNAKDKVSEFSIPGILLNENSGLDYACAVTEGRISSLNYAQGKSTCNFAGAPVYTCNTGPLVGMANGCQPLENANCPFGVGNAGIMAGQSSCAVAAEP
ncbi:MAG: prepilin-type N-terminal cleavage/methylation domain-containing protein [Bdellovibrionales bacterium]|nr:prepilin-type N-terminal cleavage/methylation domain-containing protein [Bdellovibrionales bacterium]